MSNIRVYLRFLLLLIAPYVLSVWAWGLDWLIWTTLLYVAGGFFVNLRLEARHAIMSLIACFAIYSLVITEILPAITEIVLFSAWLYVSIFFFVSAVLYDPLRDTINNK